MKEPRTTRRAAPRLKMLGIAAAALAWSAAAQAGSASINVTSFSTSVTGGGTLSWLDPYQSFQAYALDGGGLIGSNSDSYSTNDYSNLVVGADGANSSASVSTQVAQTFFASALTSASTNTTITPSNQADSFATQSGTFSLSQAGTVTFTIGYTLSASNSGGNTTTNYTTASLLFNAANGNSTSGGNQQAQLNSYDFTSNVGSKTGTLVLTVTLGAGEQGYYALDGTAVAFSPVTAVPEPATWASMAGGLLAIGALARRRLPQRRA